MCVVLDINTLHSVFTPTAEDYAQFRPILDWVDSGKGKIIYGGAHYKKELKATNKYYGILSEMKRRRKAEEIDDDVVDTVERDILEKVVNQGCNDTHIIAIIIVSRCRLVCSKDEESY